MAVFTRSYGTVSEPSAIAWKFSRLRNWIGGREQGERGRENLCFFERVTSGSCSKEKEKERERERERERKRSEKSCAKHVRWCSKRVSSRHSDDKEQSMRAFTRRGGRAARDRRGFRPVVTGQLFSTYWLPCFPGEVPPPFPSIECPLCAWRSPRLLITIEDVENRTFLDYRGIFFFFHETRQFYNRGNLLRSRARTTIRDAVYAIQMWIPWRKSHYSCLCPRRQRKKKIRLHIGAFYTLWIVWTIIFLFESLKVSSVSRFNFFEISFRFVETGKCEFEITSIWSTLILRITSFFFFFLKNDKLTFGRLKEGFMLNVLHKIFWNIIGTVTRFDCRDYIKR